MSTLGVLLGVGAEGLGTALTAVFTPASAAAFLAFTLLYTPCAAAIAAVKRELGSASLTVAVVAGQCTVAWAVSWIVYQIGGLLI